MFQSEENLQMSYFDLELTPPSVSQCQCNGVGEWKVDYWPEIVWWEFYWGNSVNKCRDDKVDMK